MSPFALSCLRSAAGRRDGNAQAQILVAVEEARREYRAAQAYFETVTDRELVDQAIHLVAAAEQKLVYLTRRAREEGVTGLP